jgi:hypothetical protein
MTKISNQYSLTNILTADLANSRLGINNVSPTVALDVTGAAKVSGISTFTTTSASTSVFNSTEANGGYISFQRSGTAYGFIGSAYHLLTPVGANTDLAVSTNGSFIIGTGASLIPRMTITSTGNVGIGTSSPAQKLTVSDNSANDLILQVRNLTSGYGTNLFLQGNDNSGAAYNSVISFTFGGTRHWGIGGGGSVGTFVIDTNGSERMRITSAGNVGIGGTAGANAKLHVFGSTAIGDVQSGGDIRLYVSGSTGSQTPGLFNNTNGGSGSENIIIFQRTSVTVGSITSTNSTTSYNTNSDYRLKEDLKPIDGLDKVSAIKVYDFKWKSSDDRMDGVLAHELAEVLPYAVTGIKDGKDMQGVDYSKIVPVLVKAIQEQQSQIQELSAKVSLLENK